VKGEPIAEKRGPKTPALKDWGETLDKTLKEVYRNRPRLPAGEYRVRMAFVIPRARYQATNKQNPNGKDLDNLVIPVSNALSKTILGEAGGDGAIVELIATKRPTAPSEEARCRVTITPRPARTP